MEKYRALTVNEHLDVIEMVEKVQVYDFFQTNLAKIKLLSANSVEELRLILLSGQKFDQDYRDFVIPLGNLKTVVHILAGNEERLDMVVDVLKQMKRLQYFG